LRDKMIVQENPEYSRDYLDPQKRSIPNAVQIFFMDGSTSENVVIEYPLGHRRRRTEGIPLLLEKFRRHLNHRFSTVQSERIMELCLDPQRLSQTPVHAFVDLWVPWK
ncbi:MAG: MmgE/PrpD family protein, partial [Anaerolineaceae bacterium]|nr:MmgE/PrpD family protein [Anaerolineaceae bacterium]